MLDQNVTQELAREAAELLSIADASDIRSLHRLATLAASQVPACSGATSALWRDGEPAEMAATHPDLADLFEFAWPRRTGPWAAALAAGQTVTSADSLAEDQMARVRERRARPAASGARSPLSTSSAR